MCEKQGAQTAKCNQLKQNVPWNCSVSRFCRCVGRWKSICSSQFWKKQSSHRSDLLSCCWQLWKRSDLAKNSITLKFCQVLFKSRDNIQPNGHFLRQLLNMHERLPVECPWVQTHWDQGKKEEKIMAGIWHNIDWCCVRLPFSALMTGQDEVYSTLIGDKKTKVSGAWWEKSKWRAEPLALQEKRSFPQFSFWKSSRNKEHRFRWSSCHLIPHKKCPEQTVRDINLIKGPDPTEVPSYLFSDMFAGNTWYKLAPRHETAQASETKFETKQNKTLCVLKFS